MIVMINILYCLDENYNYQLSVSLLSLLEQTDEKLSIYIIHKSESDSNFLPEKIKHHQNIDTISVFKFFKNIENFPKLEKAHVSEATYYRLFINEYLPKEIDFLLYLDPDVICTNNPIEYVNQLTNEMENNNFDIAAYPEILRKTDSEKLFQTLNMSNNEYFNAGVMLINYKNWLEKGINQKLVNLIDDLYEDIQFWDQDILNSYFDGRYLKLTKSYNYVLNLFYNCDNERKFNLENICKQSIFVHFAGSHKPWTPVGILSQTAEIYQSIYRKLYRQKYHITHKWKVNSLKIFKQSFIDGKLSELKYPLSFTLIFFKTLIFNK